ncbi:MAG: glyoxalase/bleomycin resistance/extradiol dioxygenase family protein [Ignavibacteriae bacterium]|nr:MAG: glyoxalase/bleomycin resistance/extradiol dioxygenase family protein [Ignavibacteriota bacterium]
MAKQIYVNLPVKDLNKTVEFFTKLGFKFNPQFTDEKATCMIIDDNIFVMLLTEEFYKSFTKKEIPDTFKTSGVIIAISAESREKVDELISKAEGAGGTVTSRIDDMDWMYNRGFQDINGHLWEVAYMDMEALKRYEEANKEKEKIH